MKIRILTSIGGNAEPMYGLPEFSFSPGEVVDLDKSLAAAWIAAGHAESVKGKSTQQELPQQEGN
jgi:hypothetical protein